MIDFQQRQINNNQLIAFAEVNYSRKKELRSLLEKKKLNLSELDLITNQARQIEWMTIRAILLSLESTFQDIYYNGHRKPFLKGCNKHISISHSHHMVAISINNKDVTGIDIQHLNHKITRIKNKFLTSSELKLLNIENTLWLTLCWSVKEALFKVYGKKDIYLKDNIRIQSIKFDGNKGSSSAYIKTNTGKSFYSLELLLINDYILAYVVNY